jgi:large subunit ribosomal protein L25
MQATLAAGTRQTRGKNEARRLRRTGRLPAVVYGKAPVESVALDVDPKAVMRILHSESGVNTLIELALDGGAADRVLVKEFQLDPISSDLLHVDFYRLAMDKALTVTVPVSLSGEAVGVKQQGGLVDFVTREVQVECMPSEIPEHIDVDITELRVGDGVRLRDRVEGVAWKPVSDPDTLLVHVLPPKVDETETEEAEAEAAAGEAEDKAAPGDDAEG